MGQTCIEVDEGVHLGDAKGMTDMLVCEMVDDDC